MTYTYWGGARGRAIFYHYAQRTRQIEGYIIILLLLFGLTYAGFLSGKVLSSVQEIMPAPMQQMLSAVSMGPVPEPSKPKTFVTGEFSPAVEAWASRSRGPEGVYIVDFNGTILAEQSADEEFFTASIYKVYVAYVGYQEVDAGKQSLNDPFFGDWTRGKCLDEMIRSSNSPCAEKMMAELGRQNIQDKLNSYGLTHTKIRGLKTSAKDISIVLGRLWNSTDLSQESRRAMLDSMLNQQYRNALPRGFTGASVYNKVGFEELSEYHDVGIVQLADGRPVIVSILTKDVGLRSILQLAQSLNTGMVR